MTYGEMARVLRAAASGTSISKSATFAEVVTGALVGAANELELIEKEGMQSIYRTYLGTDDAS